LVTNTGDNGGNNPLPGAGTGTLRQALVDVNADPGKGLDGIAFSIPGAGLHTISPLKILPLITHPVFLDGTTQPGFAGKPVVELEGSGIGVTPGANGLALSTGSDGSIIRGLVINRFFGQQIDISGSNSNQVLGNYLGTDYTGAVALPSGVGYGVGIDGSGNVIGGLAPADRNVISGNSYGGVEIGNNGATTSTNNVVEGNYLGTDASGAIALGGGAVICQENFGPNLIGGTAPGAGNLIAFNDVGIDTDPRGGPVSILGNSIFANSQLGINFQGAGVVPNTANGARNFPVLQGAATDGAGTTVSGTLNSTPGTTFRLEFFANQAPDPSGFGQGQSLLGFTSVTTDANGNASFTTTFSPAVAVGQFISATSTGPAGTSEFAQDVQVTARPAAVPVPPPAAPTPAALPQPSFFFLPPQQLRKSKSHRGARVQQLILTNTFAVPLRGKFLLSLDGLTSLQLLGAAIPAPFQATILGGSQLLIDFGPDGLPPCVGINLLLTLGKPGNNLFFPRLTFVG
jgi:hypothetical protein